MSRTTQDLQAVLRLHLVSFNETKLKFMAINNEAIRTLKLLFILNWFKLKNGNSPSLNKIAVRS